MYLGQPPQIGDRGDRPQDAAALRPRRALEHSSTCCNLAHPPVALGPIESYICAAWRASGWRAINGRERRLRRLTGVWALLAALVALLVLGGTAAAHSSGTTGRDFPTGAKSADVSGGVEFGGVALGANITECPQAGIRDRSLRRTDEDAVERLSDRGDDMRLNQDLACMPQDEMSIAINPDEHAGTCSVGPTTTASAGARRAST